MEHDLIIKNGNIVDGTGSDAYSGDISIKDGVITNIGEVNGDAAEVIDAEGMTVSPGFVDIHTHLDAQIGWDPEMTPICWHGVTTALIGNCGLTFAPCKPQDVEILAGMMETVEDIPKQAILSGLSWNWEHYGEYLDTLEELKPSLNVAGLVGHSAIRYYVMGDRSFDEQATESEKQQMADIVEKAMKDGAVGFSTNRYEPHKAPDGRAIPGTYAECAELVEIAKVVGPRDGLMQLVGADAEVMRSIAETEGSRVLFSYGCSGEEGSGTQAATNLDAMNLDGRNITGISHTRGSGYMFGLQSGLPIEGLTWDELRAKDFEGRLEAINDEIFCNALVTEAREPKSCGIPLQKVYFLGLDETPDHNSAQNLIELSKSAGEHWSETILRLSRGSNGRGLFNWRMFGGNLKEQGDLFASENLIPGLGDVGAHVSQIMDGGWASFILSHYVREKGVFTLPQAIKRMTADPAAVVGLSDRGILKAGMKADINVFNPEEVNELQPLLVNDFPGDAPRYIQKSRGFKATIVNGQVNVLNGEPTGARAGQVLRHQ
ncbi:amidohydrolase family protein [Gammaproteobacteria bacterium]|nr:amidohydrolase family protein [Gammaproteobacteria bacterium]